MLRVLVIIQVQVYLSSVSGDMSTASMWTLADLCTHTDTDIILLSAVEWAVYQCHVYVDLTVTYLLVLYMFMGGVHTLRLISLVIVLSREWLNQV